MSLQNYLNLQQDNAKDPSTLGGYLPQLVPAELIIKTCATDLDVSAVRAYIEAFSAQYGWFVARDEVIVSALAPQRDDFIEGEWSNDKVTLKVKLVAADRYRVTQMSRSEPSIDTPIDTQAYSDTLFLLRDDIAAKAAPNNIAVYRLWWAQGQGAHQGRWNVVAQQFIRFDSQPNKA